MKIGNSLDCLWMLFLHRLCNLCCARLLGHVEAMAQSATQLPQIQESEKKTQHQSGKQQESNNFNIHSSFKHSWVHYFITRFCTPSLSPSFFQAVRLRNFPVLHGMAAAGKVARRPFGVEMDIDGSTFWPLGSDFGKMMKGRLG